MLAIDNDGTKFFGALGNMGSEALTLSADDVAGGLKESAKYFADKGKANWAFVKDAAGKVEVKSGWAPFAETASTEESRAAVLKVPAGLAFVAAAALLYVCFGVFFATAKYGPGALDAVKTKAAALNESALVPLKSKLRPMITNAKAKIDQVKSGACVARRE